MEISRGKIFYYFNDLGAQQMGTDVLPHATHLGPGWFSNVQTHF